MNLAIDALRAALFAAAHLLGGSLGAGVLAVSATLRLALLPLTLKLARRARAQQRILAKVRPELKQLAARYGAQPQEYYRRQVALYSRVGYRQLDPAGLIGALAQWPVLGALFGALRRGLGSSIGFLWIPDLARPDVLLAGGVAVATGVAAWLGADPSITTPRIQVAMAAMGAVITLALCWHASSALVLSWGASSAVNALQGVLLRRDDRRR